MAKKENLETFDDLRVPYVDYKAADGIVDRFSALFARVEPVVSNAGTEKQLEAALARLTEGQRALYAVALLEMEVGNGGFEQFFSNSAGALAAEALAGLRLLRLEKFAALTERALSLFPAGKVPRGREKRRQLLDKLSDQLEDADLDSQWYEAYAAEEEIAKAALAHVESHLAEFFLDAN